MSAVAQGIHSAAGCCEEDGILQGVSGHNPVYESPGKAVAAAGGILWRDLIGLCIKNFFAVSKIRNLGPQLNQNIFHPPIQKLLRHFFGTL